MKSILLTLFLLSSLSVVASEITLAKVFNILPNAISKSCSSSFVRSEQTSNIFYISANHCLYKNGVTVLLGPKVSDLGLFRTFSSDTTLEIPYELLTKDWPHDVAYMSFEDIYQLEPSSSDPQEVEIHSYELANTPPQIGDDIFLVGFPSNGISHSKPLKVKCKFLGQSISAIPAVKKYTLQSAAECSDVGIFQGASGGAILNNKNQYVGVFTTVFNFETSNKKKHIFYTSITEKNIHENRINLSKNNQRELIQDAIEFSKNTTRKRLLLDVEYDLQGYLKEVNSSLPNGVPYQQLIFNNGELNSHHNY